jgi:Cu/Ag efflux pump CusA
LRAFIDSCIRFRLLVVALAAGVMVLGILQLSRMPADVLPETSPVTVDIQTEALGLSAAEVESLVTTPLEKNLLEGVLGVTDVTSDSIPGLSDIELHFAPGTSLYHARQLVQERLTGAFVLPNVSKPPVMLQPVSSSSDAMLVGLTSRTLSPIDLSVLARWTIVPRLLGLAGVANVSTFGQADRQLQVQVDPSVLAAHHVTLAQIIQTAGDAQLVSPLSFLEGSVPGTGGFLEGPNQRVTIQPVLPFGTPANMAQLPVADARPGLRLGDVATIVADHQPLVGDGQVNGVPGLVLVVQKLPSANVLAVTDEVDAALASIRPALPGVQVNTSLFREDGYLRDALSNLWLTLIIASVLIALALLVLFRFSAPRVVAALTAIAFSYVTATALLSLLGYTFNALVTLGLLIALGLVVAEAAGRSRTLAGGVAALASAAPLVVASGLTATIAGPMAWAFALAIAVSMVVAVTLTPAVESLVRELPLDRLWPGRGRAAGERLVARLADWQRGLVAWLSGTPRLVWGCAATAAVAAIISLAALPFVHAGQPTFADRSVVVRLTGPPGMSLTEMDRITWLVSGELRALPEVGSVGATLGRAVSSDQVENVNTGEVWVTVKPGADYASALAEVRGIASGTPGIRGSVDTYETLAMGDVLDSGGPPVVVTRLYGVNYAQLARLMPAVRTAIGAVTGVSGTAVTPPVVQPTIEVSVNLLAAARAGISPGEVRREAGTLLSGLTVGNYFENQEVFDVTVWGTAAVRDNVTAVRNLLLDAANGQHVPLGQVATVTVAPEPADLSQEAMADYQDITATVASGSSAGAVASAINARLQSLRLPAEYHAEVVTGSGFSGGATLAGTAPGAALSPNGGAAGGTSRAAFISYVIAALVAILLLIQAVTGSWQRAFLGFLLLPACLLGAVAVAFATGNGRTLAAAAGLLAVFALAARQVIAGLGRLRTTARARSAGRGDSAGETESRQDAKDASAAQETDEVREVLVPAIVTAVALLPFIALGDVPGLELLHVAAAVMLGGLVTTSAVTLVVLPALATALRPPHAVESAGADGSVSAIVASTDGRDPADVPLDGHEDRIASRDGPAPVGADGAASTLDGPCVHDQSCADDRTHLTSPNGDAASPGRSTTLDAPTRSAVRTDFREDA